MWLVSLALPALRAPQETLWGWELLYLGGYTAVAFGVIELHPAIAAWYANAAAIVGFFLIYEHRKKYILHVGIIGCALASFCFVGDTLPLGQDSAPVEFSLGVRAYFWLLSMFLLVIIGVQHNYWR